MSASASFVFFTSYFLDGQYLRCEFIQFFSHCTSRPAREQTHEDKNRQHNVFSSLGLPFTTFFISFIHSARFQSEIGRVFLPRFYLFSIIIHQPAPNANQPLRFFFFRSSHETNSNFFPLKKKRKINLVFFVFFRPSTVE